MKTPINLLQDRLEEISIQLRECYRNYVNDDVIDEIIDQYNTYFYAIQLLDSHNDITHVFSKLTSLNNSRSVRIHKPRLRYHLEQLNRMSKK